MATDGDYYTVDNKNQVIGIILGSDSISHRQPCHSTEPVAFHFSVVRSPLWSELDRGGTVTHERSEAGLDKNTRCNDLCSLCVVGSPDVQIQFTALATQIKISLSKIINAFYNSQKNHSWHKSIMVNVSTLSYKLVNTCEQDTNTMIETVGSRTLSKSIT